FKGLKAKGWQPEIGCHGYIWSYRKDFNGSLAKIDFDGIVPVLDDSETVEDKKLTLYLSDELTDIEYSEVIREIKELLY
ncbi:MAG: hypothetical protein DRP47_10900, partial [Candidatus Zixiibacteriota bacterium]